MTGEDKYYIFKTGLYKVGRKGTVIMVPSNYFSKLNALCKLFDD